MKSLVEEASSVSKAIEKAWIRAGKPVSFSVKIYEEAQSGFLGFNTTPAKIGLFFEEQIISKNQNEGRKKYHSSSSDEHDRPSRSSRPFSEPRLERSDRPERTERNERPERSEQRTEGTFERKPYGSGSREKNYDNPRSQGRHRSGSRPQGSFDKKEHDRPEREDRRKNSTPFVKREYEASGETPGVEKVTPKQPQAAQPVAQQPVSTRRVLKVSSRRYSAPKNDQETALTPSAVSDNSSDK
jgi:hypothetical protein